MTKNGEKSGGTPVTNFRLAPDVLEKLDDLVRWFAVESDDVENRTSVVRKLINREHRRLAKGQKK